VIAPLACSLVGQEQPVDIKAATRAASLYRTARITEPYYCNYGLNPSYEVHLAEAGAVVSGRGPGGEARIIELPEHPFFVATLFVPHPQVVEGGPHPLYAGLAEAVRQRRPMRLGAMRLGG
jgi:CTP synthase (UTP-ammonia lyase)